MKTLAGLLLVIVLGVVAIPHALGQHEAARPPGVPADNWVPISEQFGIVLVSRGPRDAKPQVLADPQSLLPLPASSGYFMVRRGSVWTRLSVAERPGDAY
jgi:hypothetical protein